jgi:rhodanese-related sulfurtransferase
MKNIIFMLTIGLTSISCAQSSNGNSTNSEVSNQKVERVSQTTFKDYLSKNPDVLLLDVRTAGEYDGGKIGNAINIDFNSGSFQDEISKLDKTKPVLIYCQSGGRSGKALSMMKNMGFTTVLELEGGYGSWKN